MSMHRYLFSRLGLRWGRLPPLAEISVATGIDCRSLVFQRLDELEIEGALRYDDFTGRVKVLRKPLRSAPKAGLRAPQRAEEGSGATCGK